VIERLLRTSVIIAHDGGRDGGDWHHGHVAVGGVEVEVDFRRLGRAAGSFFSLAPGSSPGGVVEFTGLSGAGVVSTSIICCSLVPYLRRRSL